MAAQLNDSLFFEDYKAGLVIHSTGRTITEADIVNFAGLSGDYNPLHTDAEFAGKSVFGSRIAHGLLGVSILTGLVHELGIIKTSAVAFVNLEWKFKAPVRIGDTIKGAFTIVKTRGAGAKQGIVVFDVALTNQKGESCGEGRWGLMVRKKSA